MKREVEGYFSYKYIDCFIHCKNCGNRLYAKVGGRRPDVRFTPEFIGKNVGMIFEVEECYLCSKVEDNE